MDGLFAHVTRVDQCPFTMLRCHMVFEGCGAAKGLSTHMANVTLFSLSSISVVVDDNISRNRKNSSEDKIKYCLRWPHTYGEEMMTGEFEIHFQPYDSFPIACNSG